MPRHNNTVAAQRLREWMGAKGVAGIDTVSPEIVPVIAVADLTGQDVSAREERYFQGFHTQAAVAGEYAHVQAFLPATATREAYLDAVMIRHGASAVSHLRIYDTALTTQSGNVSLVDIPGQTGWPWGGGANDPNVQLRAQSSASVLGSIILNGNIVAANSFHEIIPLGIRLLPGRGVHIVCLTVNTLVQTSWVWREFNLVP